MTAGTTAHEDAGGGATAQAAERGSRSSRIVVTALLGLIAAWFTWDSVGNLVALPILFEQLGLGDSVPWTALVLGVAMPPAVYLAGVMLGRRQPLARYTLVLIASLGAIAAMRLSLIAATTGTISVIG